MDQDQAQKITGMIIDLPIPIQKKFLMSYEYLQTVVKEAQQDNYGWEQDYDSEGADIAEADGA